MGAEKCGAHSGKRLLIQRSPSGFFGCFSHLFCGLRSRAATCRLPFPPSPRARLLGMQHRLEMRAVRSLLFLSENKKLQNKSTRTRHPLGACRAPPPADSSSRPPSLAAAQLQCVFQCGFDASGVTPPSQRHRGRLSCPAPSPNPRVGLRCTYGLRGRKSAPGSEGGLALFSMLFALFRCSQARRRKDGAMRWGPAAEPASPPGAVSVGGRKGG